jgi:uncharacterized membrane protein YphA (DoxX/SURF4 family)
MENSASGERAPWNRAGYSVLVARLILGSVFCYFGLVKAIDPIGFLKLLRQFDVMPGSMALNLAAAILPWLEMLCGLLLLAGVALRGTALLVLLMLIGFTTVVFLRAQGIYESGTSAFCAIRFDCGCGAGDILICRKLAENAGLCVLSWIVLVLRTRKLCRGKDSEARPGTRETKGISG